MTVLIATLAGAGMRVYAAPLEQDSGATSGPTSLAATNAGSAPAELVPPASPVVSSPGSSANAQMGAPAVLAKGKKAKKKKEKAPKLTPVHIEQGTLTVDGWTGKARLNYDIPDLKYIYVWVPGTGTLVASNTKFPLSKEQVGGFNGNTLTLEANGHQIQISSEQRLLKSKKPVSAWVYLDTAYSAKSPYPEMGYGNGKDAPYAWPGAKAVVAGKGGAVAAPPLPIAMRPTIAKPACVGVAGAPASCPAAPSVSATSLGTSASAPATQGRQAASSATATTTAQ